MPNKAFLIILDGWGLGPKPEADAIKQAHTPFFDSLMAGQPHSTLTTFGEAVGLPKGQTGNSEVGHLNIGAGRIVYQELTRIDKAIRNGSLEKNPLLQQAFRLAKEKGKNLHFMGLVSDGGVHSHINHLLALCDMATRAGVKKIYLHAFTDGRDVDPTTSAKYLHQWTAHCRDKAQLATVIGRYYAMDRDKRWERTKMAYDALVHGIGTPVELSQLETRIKEKYKQGETDEFIKPLILIDKAGKPMPRIQPGDVVINFNFRTDRPRQITEMLTQRDMPEFGTKKLPLYYLSMTRYEESFRNIHVLFEKENLKNTIGEWISQAGLSQLRIAETEKYAHVTYFFSGGREEPFPGENRILIPSPRDVPTYDLKPEMSAPQVTKAAIDYIEQHKPDFIVLNYANTDMVGHTGVFSAAMKAAETVDECLRQLVTTARQYEYEILIIADHGNSDYMINEDGSPNTAHTKNPVPCIYLGKKERQVALRTGILADVAPTLLELMELKPPPIEQDPGHSLLTKANP